MSFKKFLKKLQKRTILNFIPKEQYYLPKAECLVLKDIFMYSHGKPMSSATLLALRRMRIFLII